jgi:hypothetical protein
MRELDPGCELLVIALRSGTEARGERRSLACPEIEEFARA